MVARWKGQYDTILERYKFLVVRGASRTGKSTLARSLGGPAATPFIQTVQSAADPDLRTYDPDFHSYVVFDNVNNMKFILDYRALLQANNDIHVLGESKTGMSTARPPRYFIHFSFMPEVTWFASLRGAALICMCCPSSCVQVYDTTYWEVLISFLLLNLARLCSYMLS